MFDWSETCFLRRFHQHYDSIEGNLHNFRSYSICQFLWAAEDDRSKNGNAEENILRIATGGELIRGGASRFEGTCFLDDTASFEVVG